MPGRAQKQNRMKRQRMIGTLRVQDCRGPYPRKVGYRKSAPTVPAGTDNELFKLLLRARDGDQDAVECSATATFPG